MWSVAGGRWLAGLGIAWRACRMRGRCTRGRGRRGSTSTSRSIHSEDGPLGSAFIVSAVYTLAHGYDRMGSFFGICLISWFLGIFTGVDEHDGFHGGDMVGGGLRLGVSASRVAPGARSRSNERRKSEGSGDRRHVDFSLAVVRCYGSARRDKGRTASTPCRPVVSRCLDLPERTASAAPLGRRVEGVPWTCSF